MEQLVCLSTSATAGVLPLSLLLFIQSDFELFRCAARVTIHPKHKAVVSMSHGDDAMIYKNFKPKDMAKISRSHKGKATISTITKCEAK